jgi:urease accessory protein
MLQSAETAAQLGLLQLVQWLSPAFPTGAFAYSHGLEFEVSAGRVTSAVELDDWLRGVLGFGAGWQDAVILSQALDLNANLSALATLAEALAPSAERLVETLEQGAAFARATSALTGFDLPACALPVAVGQAARTLSLPKTQVIALYLHGFTANLVSAAVRFVPLGQTEGQGVLAGLHPVIQSLAAKAATATLDDLATSALRADLASMRHETMPVRIFRT